MKALVLHKVKDLRYEEVKTPKIKEREALVKVKVAGICGSDIPRVMKTGAHKHPIIIGHEFSGIVEETGGKVEKVEKGDRVTAYPLIPCFRCTFCNMGKYNLCNKYTYLGSSVNGAFAEYVAIPYFNVMKLDKIDFESGAMVDPSSVALHAVRKLGPRIESTIAVLGAGPIGLFAIQWLKLQGVKNIVVSDIVDEKLTIAKKLGADICINNLSEDVINATRDLTNGKGVDGAIEAAGLEKTINQSLKIVKKEGRISFSLIVLVKNT
jgi:L-iditol 2-dehydrogenase